MCAVLFAERCRAGAAGLCYHRDGAGAAQEPGCGSLQGARALR